MSEEKEQSSGVRIGQAACRAEFRALRRTRPGPRRACLRVSRDNKNRFPVVPHVENISGVVDAGSLYRAVDCLQACDPSDPA
ncbi:hypothetical protein COCON_G00211580 [Conger conger]|uniref:Uncharacterized protein n=1 Tax=Conger conger TaxID=82655 RepID=A0A9Q1D0Q8_CONCO|nr:hypothetical protein COCON_G00211580 [Conger conger]